jgi:predicted transcriptional regulator
MLDNCTVRVKLPFLQSFHVPSIGHYEAIRKEIIRLLREERERQLLSKYAIAQRSGVSESMVGLLERGLRNPSLELILRLADGIGADLPKLIKQAQATVQSNRGKTVSKTHSH